MIRILTRRIFIALLILLATFIRALAADNDSTMLWMRSFFKQAMLFAEKMPREKFYLHLDNTGYFKGDKIWFQCYVVDGINNMPTQLSHTLYVELLSPRGKVVSRRILKIENGRCHGEFTINHLPFYSGFYEIRAYTKYMLNFGETAMFSRVIPVFDPPAKPGDFAEWRMARSITKYSGTRPATKSASKVWMRFFPEGGSLIAGVPAKVAFEITGRDGSPIEAAGYVVDESTRKPITAIQTLHEGRGVFEITPESGGDYKAIITYGNDKKEHEFKLPQVRKSGVGLSVDNLSLTDSILVSIRPGEGIGADGDIAGLAITSRGALWSYTLFDLTKERTLKLSRRDMPTGVSVITLFGSDGHTLAERMIFVNNGGYGSVNVDFDIVRKEPLDNVALNIMAKDSDGSPAAFLPISVSVTDGDNAVDYQGSLLSDLLLMSEVKGYVRKPMQYFHTDSDINRRNLDLLMMVLGWRCYSWEEMVGLNPVSMDYSPESAIGIEGRVVSFGRGIPKPGVDVSVMFSEKEIPDSLRHAFAGVVTTDSCGYFSMSYDLTGKWYMVMSVSENDKKKDHRVILNRLFSPAPRMYEPAEMMLDNFLADNVVELHSDSLDTEDESGLEIEDSDHDDKDIKLREVVVVGKNSRESDIYKARSRSVEYYDMREELGNLTDKGEYVGKDLFDVLKSLNNNFQKVYSQGDEIIFYKTKKPLFVIDYKVSYLRDSLNYTLLYPESVKSIFITEDPAIMVKYADPHEYNMFTVDDTYGCAVLIETIPDYKGPTQRGTRLLPVAGSTVPQEFQNVSNPELLDLPDFRRTLYWNPLLTTGADGKAHVEFLNNSTCRNLRVTIHGIDNKGNVYSY